MARGYPDFFGYSVFPGPGIGASNIGGVVNIAPAATETLVELLVKGNIFGGYLYGDDLGPNGLYTIRLTIDGVNVEDCILNNLYLLNQYQDGGFLFALYYYNVEDNDWSIRVTEKVSFGFQYRLECINNDANAVNITTNLYYYRVV